MRYHPIDERSASMVIIRVPQFLQLEGQLTRSVWLWRGGVDRIVPNQKWVREPDVPDMIQPAGKQFLASGCTMLIFF
jgi:hypothetical protein